MKLVTLASLSVCLGVLFSLSSCKTPGMPDWDGKVYQGSSVVEGIVRSQENETIYCNEPKFDEFVCVSLEDLQKLYANILKCKKWEE